MKVIGLVFWTALIALFAAGPSATVAQSCGPRLRKSWLSLSTSEQTLYKDAIAAAMDSGAYIKFVEMHTEMMSEMEAHRQCMFIYWHRLLLLAFENMLRGQGAKFACVTVPYWDWMSDYNRFVSGQCTNMLDCSFALQALGGVSGTRQTTIAINGEWTQGVCTNKSPLNHFCQEGNLASWRCAKCIPRGLWKTTTLPASASYASVKSQLFSASNIAEMSSAIETGAHNNIHANLAGAMETFASPADPIFWSHHAMVDLLHTIFHKCRVGMNKLTLAQKAAHPVGWSSCERRDGSPFNPLDTVVMRTGVRGNNPVAGRKDRVIGKFFNGLPTQFAALMDHSDLGTSSYAYVYQGLLGELYAQCGQVETSPANPANSTRRRLEDSLAAAINATSLAFNTSVIVADPTASVTNVAAGEFVLVTQASSASATPANSSVAIATNDSSTSVRLVAAVNTTLEDSTLSVSAFTIATNDKLVAQTGRPSDDLSTSGTVCVASEQEKMTCMFQDECLGGVRDYSATFKKNFQITEPPRCKRIVDSIRRGDNAIALRDWKQIMTASFGCPLPTETPKLKAEQ